MPHCHFGHFYHCLNWWEISYHQSEEMLFSSQIHTLVFYDGGREFVCVTFVKLLLIIHFVCHKNSHWGWTARVEIIYVKKWLQRAFQESTVHSDCKQLAVTYLLIPTIIWERDRSKPVSLSIHDSVSRWASTQHGKHLFQRWCDAFTCYWDQYTDNFVLVPRNNRFLLMIVDFHTSELLSAL